ncbi:hypothetical protein JZ751_011894 [Albula glossodonta]|uniref:Uncharacterized protein n=1 Tax=Albula glossodonta TaxID=121402 RepID=A0A8T2PR59_9TELE|nr:hypothetical protein JZ751_011894 [Albula glossodonta]
MVTAVYKPQTQQLGAAGRERERERVDGATSKPVSRPLLFQPTAAGKNSGLTLEGIEGEQPVTAQRMFSRNRVNEQDGTGIIQHKKSKKKDLAKKRTQSSKVAQGLRSKIQKFLQGPGEHSAHSNRSPVEIERDMFICGIKRDPSSGEFSALRVPNGRGHAGAPTTSCIGEVELNREGYVKIPCTIQNNGLSSNCQTSDGNSSGNAERLDEGESQSVTSEGEESVISAINSAVGEEEEEEEEEGEETSDIVEHILKELRGINKIQEEISDLRQYLTSVRGSVDEVSSCVDAVLSEIEGLRSGVSARPSHPQRPSSHCGSLGKEEEIMPATLGVIRGSQSQYYAWGEESKVILSQRSPLRRPVPAHQVVSLATSRGEPSGSKVCALADQNISDQSSDLRCMGRKASFGYLERQDGQDCPSTSSLSSGHSSKSDGSESGKTERFCPGREHLESNGWLAAGMQHSVSGEAGWSEEEGYSHQNSTEEGENFGEQDNWDRYGGGETSSTPGQSSFSSSEHLSLLFGRHYNSPSSSSSLADWRSGEPRPRDGEIAGNSEQGLTPNLECECTASCPYSRSSGYHTAEVYADEIGSAPSGSLSHNSTVVFTDCDDYCQEVYSSCELCPAADALDTGSVQSEEREWAEPVCSGEEDGFHLDFGSSGLDPEEAELNMGFNVKRIGKAVLTFKSALKGALKKLEGTGPQGSGDERDSTEFLASPGDQSNEMPWAENSQGDTEGEASLVSDHCLSESQQGVCSDISVSLNGGPEEPHLSSTPPENQGSPNSGPSCFTSVESHSAEDQPVPCEPQLDEGHSDAECAPEHSLAVGELSQQEARRLKCLNNFQRVLREKRLVRHKLSQMADGSKSIYSEEDYNPEGSREDDQVTLASSPLTWPHIALWHCSNRISILYAPLHAA